MALTPKGEARRDALLAACVRFLETDGPAGVTHRAVAREAGVPLAAATYYFASIDDLLVSALRRATADQVTLFATLSGSGIRAFAEGLFDWTHNSRATAIAQYELMFLAMRRPALRGDAELWYAALEDAIAPLGLGAARSRTVALAIDGLALRMLWQGDPATVDATEDALRDILEG